MARPRAQDHEEKREGILRQAAELFAQHGYDRASMAMLAEACGVSKALLYHYYKDKEALLFDVLALHLHQLVLAVREAADPALPPRARLEAMATALLLAYREADAIHHVQITCLRLLSPERQDSVKALERALVAEVSAVVAELDPETGRTPRLLKPLTMSIFAMLNWHYHWHREGGPLSREDYARIAIALVAEGLEGAKAALRVEAQS
ncbi:TetR/AcrR family transcriptional regulator [Roseomonas sp. GC11]|uniref:TetR/AcrR family transcriptional regulator n=1 Tax=Roseomonas sp. GC11 TaxID=2950546 RepID=UPI00210C6E30|nr:TetR/AcrR family transcriptional regulator [Roseomonas sp. GC11]MCQ4160025.1 TetR/AcrR family transcriptional regulator [Roseomonas sp. GC11]